MSAHAEWVYPEECCGLMLGTITSQDSGAQDSGAQDSGAHKYSTELVPLDNDWAPDVLPADLAESVAVEHSQSKQRRYWINPEDMLRVQKTARDRGLVIVGIYHSHPDHVAEPSECDRVLAWPAYAYTIVSVRQGKAVDVQNWTLDSDHQFRSEPIRVSPS
ncbi:MAG: M67 family metallopeptidase, partial [Phormidesmis sp.]